MVAYRIALLKKRKVYVLHKGEVVLNLVSLGVITFASALY
jgi:hypothetical protein